MAKALIQRELKRYRVDVRAIEQQTHSIYIDDPNDFLISGMFELLYQYQRIKIALNLKYTLSILPGYTKTPSLLSSLLVQTGARTEEGWSVGALIFNARAVADLQVMGRIAT